MRLEQHHQTGWLKRLFRVEPRQECRCIIDTRRAVRPGRARRHMHAASVQDFDKRAAMIRHGAGI